MKTLEMISDVGICLLLVIPSSIAAQLDERDSKEKIAEAVPKIDLSRIGEDIGGLFREAKTSLLEDTLTTEYHCPIKEIVRGEGRFKATIKIKSPDDDGFIISIRFRRGQYDEAAVRPAAIRIRKEVNRPEFDYYHATAAVDIVPQNIYIVVDVKYGKDADLAKLMKAYQLLTKHVAGVPPLIE